MTKLTSTWPADESGLRPIEWWAAKDPDERTRLLALENRRRARLVVAVEEDDDYRQGIVHRTRRDVKFFFDQFVSTYDPREMRHYPMVLWPIQRTYLDFVEARIAEQRDWLCEKSRDMGVTYLNSGLAVHRWIFAPGFKSGFCANKSDLVDELGNPDTIFEKVRMIIEALPWFIKPAGYSRTTHAMSNRIVHPTNGNVIIGEGGTSAGRGGRNSVYFVDEAAHVDNAELVNAATSANSRCRGWISSANGIGNFFYQRRVSGDIPVITVHWREHPLRDDAWAAAEKKRITTATFASELDIDYAASLSGMVVEKPWVDAAVELWKLLPHPQHDDRCAGMDVAAGGRDVSVFQPRVGHLVSKAHSRAEGDTTDTAHWSLELARRYGVRRLVYDSIGVGEGVNSTLRRGVREEPNKGIRVVACNWGGPPVGNRKWEDGRTSKQRFRDIKAELGWIMRTRFRNSHELWLHLTGQEGGVAHDPSDCLLLEPSPDLQAQLPTVKWQYTETGGKIEIESKRALKARGVKSPDFWDALAYSFHEGPAVVDLRTGIILGPTSEAAAMEW